MQKALLLIYIAAHSKILIDGDNIVFRNEKFTQ